ncbi:MAG: hypothetical protein KDB07_09000, partial [Planctomycetes bacterium]|nr:hypothetical protein [Planctomycetota bacterium]
QLSRFPLSAPQYGEDPSFRRRSGEGKTRNYFIYYQVSFDKILILRVIHSARDQDEALDQDASG